uniref:Solute carrier family 26 member 4 n=1 Tax=Scleropages formosus TaxID=113540 RepID=A0A8C9WRP6_SCLFO
MSTHASSHQYFISRPIYSYPDFNVENEHCTGVDRTFRDRLSESYRCSGRTALRLIKSIFPVTDWLFRYPVREWLLSDIISGVSTGLVSSLQGLAYALLVSVSPVYGLYSAFFPIIPYFIFGTSRHVSVGPFPVTCLMVGSVVMTLTPDDDFLVPLNISGVNETTVDVEAREAQRIVIACSMTVLIGLIQVIMGLLQVGFLVRYLSDPLVGGFTTAAALHVFISQLKTILSVPTSSHSGLFSIAYTLGDVLRNIKQTNTADLLAGLMTIAVVMTVKEFNAKFQHKIPVSIPIELIVTVVATGISYAVDLESRYGASTVRSIPRGFASPSLPDQGVFWKTLEPGFSTAVVGYAVAVSVAKVYAAKNDYAINGNQELIAFGISNVFSGCFSSFVASTALSRTAVQASTGGKTQVAGVISATVVMVVILALGQLLEPLQKSVLAGVVIANLRGMFLQVLDVLVLWRQNRADCLIWIATCLASVVLGLDVGLLTGLAFEICTVVFRTQFPTCSTLGSIPHTDIYRNVKGYKNIVEVAGVKIFKCNSPIYFANIDYFKEQLKKAVGFDAVQVFKKRNKALKKIQKLMKKEKLKTSKNGVVSAVSLCQENKGFEGEGDVVRVGPGERADLHLDWASKLPVPVNVPRVQIHSLVLDFSAVSFLDVVAVKALRLVDEMVKNMESLSFFDEAVTKDLLFLSVHDAVLFIRRGEADGSLQNPALRSVRSMSDTFTVVEYIHSTVRPFVLMDYKCCLFVPRGWAKGLSPQWVRCRCSCPARSQWMTD